MTMKKPKQPVKTKKSARAKEEGSHEPNPSTVALLVVGTDQTLHEDSPARRRAIRYAKSVSQYDVIVYGRGVSTKSTPLSVQGSVIDTFSPNVFVSLYRAYQKGCELIRMAPERPWVVSAQDPFESGLIAYAIAKKTGAALHLQLHTDPDALAWGSSKKNRLRNIIFRFLAPRADAFRVVSERAKSAALSRGANTAQMHIIPIVSDDDARTPSRVDIRGAYKEAGEIILAMGRLSHEKGFDLLIDAMRAISVARPSALLLMVGSGPEEHALKRRAERLGIARFIRFVPWVRDVSAYLYASTVVVVPSRFEGWGLIACEAAGHGKVVVMTDTGCAGDVIIDNETGIVVPPEDVDALSGAVIKVLANDALRDRLGMNAKRRASNLVTNSQARKLHQESWENAYHNHVTKKKTPHSTT